MQKDSERETQSAVVRLAEEAVEQENLFGTSGVSNTEQAEESSPPEHIAFLTDQSTIAESVEPYKKELMLRGKSNYTVTCFLSDLKMLTTFLGAETPVGRIRKEDVTDWLMKLKFGVPGTTPAAKTMARRVTFLKNYFTWLEHEHIIPENPAASLTLERPMPPLPELLTDEEIGRLLEAAEDDARCQSLIYLVLKAGLKKEEVMGLKVQHIDLVDPNVPLVTVRFATVINKQHRERRIALPSEFSAIFRRYQKEYAVNDAVFACTDRNLNYILARAVKTAQIEKRVTLQLLRDTFAVLQLRDGVTLDALREKLGLSDEAWLESKEKYRRLAFPDSAQKQPVSK